MTWNIKLLFLTLDWQLATTFRESCFSLSPTLYSSVLNKGLTLPLSCHIINLHTGLREWEMGRLKISDNKAGLKARGNVGPGEPKLVCDWNTETTRKHHSRTNQRSRLAKERNQTASKSPRWETARELWAHERATEMERHKNPRTGRAPIPPAPHQAVLCLACLLFLLPSVPGYIWLVFCGSAQRSFQGSFPHPRRADHRPSGLICTPRKVLTVSTNGSASSPMTFLIVQTPICQEYFLSIFTHQCLAYSGIQ